MRNDGVSLYTHFSKREYNAVKRLPENCSTLYADLLQKTMDSSLVSLTGGSFVSKTIGNSTHWYYQTKQVLGKRKQTWVGKETPELLEKIKEARDAKYSAAAILEERKRLVGMLSVGGATMEKGRSAKIIESMSNAGLFRSGGTLVGSFAFGCYGNMLGVRFDSALQRTQDMDFSIDREIEIGIERDLRQDLVTVDSTLAVPRQVNPAVKPFEMIAADGFKVEFLTTQRSALEKAPVLIDRFSVYAMPLPYMDYLLEHNQAAVVLYGAGIPVMVPDPARFALHKLAVSQLRPIGTKAKSDKDIQQAAAVLEVLLEDNPGLIMLAAESLNSRSDMMVNDVRKGAGRLPEGLRKTLVEWLPEKKWDTALGLSKSKTP